MRLDLKNYGMPRPPFMAGLVLALLLAGIITLSDIASGPLPLSEQPAAVLPGAIVALTNEERADNDLGSLRASPLLNRAAQLKADDMAAKSYYAHVSPDGTIPPKWLDKVVYRYEIMAENLVVDRESSEDVVSAWMGSTDHRHNILNPTFTEIGIGVAYGNYKGRDTIYVVQVLAKPQKGQVEKPTPNPTVTTVSFPTPKPTPTRTAATTSVLVRPQPTPQPVRDTLTPIVTAIASSTLVEVPNIVASSSFPTPALASDTEAPIVISTDIQPVMPRITLRTKMRSFMQTMESQIRSFLRL